MKTSMERKIGEIFEYNDEWYQCLENNSYCCGCDYCDFGELGDCDIIACSSSERNDNKEVYFKKLEKVGEPYEYFVQHKGIVMLQPYKLFTIPFINGVICNVHNDTNTIDLEIKQTKENMEEYKMYDAKEDIPEFDKVVDECLFGKDKLNLKPFNLEEALKIAYIPIILTKSAFEYADFARQICVAKRLPHAKESRIIKEAFTEYERGIMNELREEVKEGLEAKMEYFFDEADREIQTLWYSISGELKKEYPELDNYDLLTNIYTAVAILDYVRKFERAAAIEIMRRTGTGYACMENKYSIRVRNALLSIAGKYTMKNTDMLKLAIRVLAIKVDGMIKVEYDNN